MQPKQLTLEFPTITIECDHCHRPVGLDPRNEYLFNGFLDADNSLFICRNCRDPYYVWKIGEAEGTTYSEMPATVGTLTMAKKQIHNL